MNHTIIPMIDTGDEQIVKLGHDRYEVYVNGDFVGFKILLTPNDEIDELKSFLNEHGFHTFAAYSEGDRYEISAVDSVPEMKDVLRMYLQMR